MLIGSLAAVFASAWYVILNYGSSWVGTLLGAVCTDSSSCSSSTPSSDRPPQWLIGVTLLDYDESDLI